MSWADVYDEEYQPKVYDELMGHVLGKEEVLEARMNEIEPSPTWALGRLHLVRTWAHKVPLG